MGIIKFVHIEMLIRHLIATVAITFLSGCVTVRPPSPEAVKHYEPQLAESLLEFSDFAYIDDKGKLEAGLKDKYPAYTLLRKTTETETGYGVQGFVAYSSDTIVIAIRGSESPITTLDWINNIKFFQFNNQQLRSNCPDAGVHGGFFQSALRLRSLGTDPGDSGTLYNSLLKLQSEGRRLYVTGHSLGGATANILAMFLAYESELRIDGVYTYGEPKGGDYGYQKCHDAVLRDKTFRFVNRNDFVTRVQISRDYTHVGNPIWFNSRRHVFTCQVVAAMDADTFEVPFASFLHHRIKEYRSAVQYLGKSNPFESSCNEVLDVAQ